MKFRGLFIGVDKYETVSWLGGATNDARALHALFSDTLGRGGTLLTDQAASRRRISDELDALTDADEDDLVFVSFSGHGTDNHSLAPYEADVDDLAGTCLPLSELATTCERIRSHRFVLVLDCCFSGGYGRVLRSGVQTRSLTPIETTLARLGGKGHVVLTASSGDQEALEIEKHGHGLLTYHLLAGLRGAQEVVQHGKVNIIKLFEFLAQRVKTDADTRGHSQDPCFRGEVDGILELPQLHPGATFALAFPQHNEAVTSDATTLGKAGLSTDLANVIAARIPVLNDLQVAALNDYGLLQGKHLSVSAPTSSGKTLIGELGALRATSARRKALILLPLKALVSEKLDNLTSAYAAHGIRVVSATGENSGDVPDIIRGRFDICVATYEKLSGLMLSNPRLIETIGTIVVDEAQMIVDPNRGKDLEFLLTYIIAQRRWAVEPQLIMLSAVIGDSDVLGQWIGGRELRSAVRPVPLKEGVLSWTGEWRHVDDAMERTTPSVRPEYSDRGSSRALVIPIVRKLVKEGKPTIVFRETKGETVFGARYLATSLGLPPATNALARLPSSDLSRASRALRDRLAGGVAFHNSDLDATERAVVERGFREGEISVLVATTTLAMGINTPAAAVVIVGLEHPGSTPYTVAEYKNMVGRAGRVGYSETGESYLIAKNASEEEHYWRHYTTGSPESLVSQFFSPTTDMRTLVLRALASVHGTRCAVLDKGFLVSFLSGSLGALQARLADASWRLAPREIDGAVDELEGNALISSGEEGYVLTELGRIVGQTGFETESAIRVISACRGLRASVINDASLIALAQLTVELDGQYFPMNRKSTLKEPTAWFGELSNQRVPTRITDAFGRNCEEPHTRTLRAKRASAALYWMTDWSIDEIENRLTRFGGTRDAAGPIRSNAARICDVLTPIMKIVEYLSGQPVAANPALLMRIEVGLPADCAGLADIFRARLTRSEYLALRSHGVLSQESFLGGDEAMLATCVGGPARLLELRDVARDYAEMATEASTAPLLPAPSD